MNQSDILPSRIRSMKQKVGGMLNPAARNSKKLDGSAVLAAYARWAPVYDLVFAGPLYWGRRAAVSHLNKLEGNVLEAGVGTGMSLPLYGDHLKISGIDVSDDMLQRARKRVAHRDNIQDLQVMDAGELAYPDNHFDAVVAMYLITVVPDPEKVMRELERVTKPGGTVLLVNHFSAQSGVRAKFEQGLERFGHRLGWNPEFPRSRILGRTQLELEHEETLPPFKLFTLMSFRKPE
ncbi:methyltransferase domain-containing protein [Rhodobacterales bacterium]|nr:methyltransferase domain-containing protein [Rhodobacterales bacterium]